MNDDKTAQILEDLHRILESSQQFVLEQAPPLAREMILYARITETFLLAAAVAMLVAGLIVARRGYKHSVADQWREFPGLVMIGGIGAFLGGFSAILQFGDVVQAWFAPRYWLLARVMALLGRGGCH